MIDPGPVLLPHRRKHRLDVTSSTPPLKAGPAPRFFALWAEHAKSPITLNKCLRTTCSVRAGSACARRRRSLEKE
ncbi:hypothetical protein NDU88_000990 [Pleurodeles waltl]|uniref:Uncharacterized protein n=1 Tax=Pleurodeles waltl TaxID=8319 RepID=A0AAV7Q5R5_PLEWA|nr:hypothetical protein NDU88_000990 [Pleurodeles waltl]